VFSSLRFAIQELRRLESGRRVSSIRRGRDVFLAGMKYRGFSLPASANPGQQNGGIVGEV